MNILRQTSLFLLLGLCANGQTTAWKQGSPTTVPSARSQHAMAYDAARQQTVLFGGFAPNLALGDTWVWDGSTWTRKGPQNAPLGRYGHLMAYDVARQQVVLFGGTTYLSDGSYLDLNDTWVWDGVNWTSKSPQTPPLVREGASMAYDAARGQVILFGGVLGNNFNSNCVAPLGDTWAWDGSNWNKLTPAASPSPRFLYSMAYDAE